MIGRSVRATATEKRIGKNGKPRYTAVCEFWILSHRVQLSPALNSPCDSILDSGQIELPEMGPTARCA
jgi:hypothetical protein